MPPKRQQLTLSVAEKEAMAIEQIRHAYNSQQFDLIKAHVTLCREEEIANITRVVQNLSKLQQNPITLSFGKAIRFADGKGVLMPAIGNNAPFEALRASILQGLIENPREHAPHITLMHPRNATCNDAIFAHIEQIALPQQITFKKISLIEQEIGEKWITLREFELDL